MADEYQTRFDQYTSAVPRSNKATVILRRPTGTVEYWGDLLSGSPLKPMPQGDLERYTAKMSMALDTFNDNADFTRLADGLTHTKLMRNWAGGGIMTSCNAFVGYVTKQFGLGGLGGFNVENILIGKGKQHCWIRPSSGERPKYGDLFETRSVDPGKGYENLHVGFSLSVDGPDWKTIEGGQGGPVMGCDKISRIKKPYNTAHLLGWVDMRLLLSGKAAVPMWLGGLWTVSAGPNRMYYDIDRYGEVRQKAGGDPNSIDLDSGTLAESTGQTATIRWASGRTETFTYDQFGSVFGVNDRMNGKTADGTPLVGTRLIASS